MTSLAPTPSPSAAASPSRTRDVQQTTMTQHYGVRSAGPNILPLPSGWMQLADATTNRAVYYHKATSRMVFSRAEMFLKSPPVTPPVTPSPAPRNCSSPATVQCFELPDKAVSAPFPPTHREGTEGTNEEEAIELSSSSSSVGSSVSELSISQTQTMRRTTTSIQSDADDSEATSY
jgi:hypothetical protein